MCPQFCGSPCRACPRQVVKHHFKLIGNQIRVKRHQAHATVCGDAQIGKPAKLHHSGDIPDRDAPDPILSPYRHGKFWRFIPPIVGVDIGSDRSHIVHGCQAMRSIGLQHQRIVLCMAICRGYQVIEEQHLQESRDVLTSLTTGRFKKPYAIAATRTVNKVNAPFMFVMGVYTSPFYSIACSKGAWLHALLFKGRFTVEMGKGRCQIPAGVRFPLKKAAGNPTALQHSSNQRSAGRHSVLTSSRNA